MFILVFIKIAGWWELLVFLLVVFVVANIDLIDKPCMSPQVMGSNG
jgi:hypothetical protein